MTLYWPNDPNQIDLTGPRLHAFIVGVGDYPHLRPGAPNSAGTNFGLQQLTTTTVTAKRLAQWFATEYKNPAVPLGSIELLLSPSEQLARPNGALIAIEDATMANIRKVFRPEWILKRCNAQAGNIALFYFAGHGLSTASLYLLASDFGDPNAALWDHCIDFDKTRTGMRSCNAETQLFFVDACRESPIDALIQSNPAGQVLANANLFDTVATTGTYYAAADGLQAYGPNNDVTFFAQALLDALEGASALRKNGLWVVDTFQLGAGLGHMMQALAAEHNQPLSCNPSPSGTPVPLHYPDAPRVRASVGCQTAQANAEAEIVLQQGAMSQQSHRGDRRPWKGQLALGDVDITVTFQTLPQVVARERVQTPIFEHEVNA